MGQDLASCIYKKDVIYQSDRYMKRGRDRYYNCKVDAAYLIIISTNTVTKRYKIIEGDIY
jgi:hypothetical protein